MTFTQELVSATTVDEGTGLSGAMVIFPNPVANGTLLVNTVTGNISLLGVTIGVVPPSGGELYPLVIKGDFFFRGLVPEPGTALLVGGGIVGLLAAGRRIRS